MPIYYDPGFYDNHGIEETIPDKVSKIMKILRALLLTLLLCVLSINATAEPVNINTADAQTLATLEGIGEKRAEAIIEYRAEHGAFESVDDLIKVKGIGPKTVEKKRDSMTVE